MIKLKDIIKEIKIGEEIPIGDDYILRRLGQFGNLFKVYNKNYGNDVCLSAYIITKDTSGELLKIPWVAEVDVDADHRGKGLYRRILPLLKKHFGAIRSDNRGMISDEAEKAWISVGARKVLRSDNKQLYGGSWYVLEDKDPTYMEESSKDNQTYIYHGTNEGAGYWIQKSGKMKLNAAGNNEPFISFTSNLNVANYYAIAKGGKERGVILRTIRTEDFVLSNKFKKNNGYEWITKREIPLNELEVLIKNKWISLKNYNFVDKKIVTI